MPNPVIFPGRPHPTTSGVYNKLNRGQDQQIFQKIGRGITRADFVTISEIDILISK